MKTQQFLKSDVYTESKWAMFTVPEFAGIVAETPCSCGGKCNYRGFAMEKVSGLIHRHFSICKVCKDVLEF